MSDSQAWKVDWYRPHEVILMQFWDHFSVEALDIGLTALGALLDTATGEYRIPVIVDESRVTSIDANIHVSASLHPSYFHVRGGRVYIISSHKELRGVNEALAARREGVMLLMDTLEEAVADIDRRRAIYLAKKAAEKG